MANRILTTTDYEGRIRSRMGVSEPYLPNDDINQPDIITVAEANIIAQVPDYATLESESDARVYLESAVVLECCVLLCPSMSARLPKKESGPHATYELGTDWDKKKTEFMEERDRWIGKVLELAFPSLLSTSLPHFSVTYPVKEW